VPESENEEVETRMKAVTLFPRGSQTRPRFFNEDALLQIEMKQTEGSQLRERIVITDRLVLTYRLDPVSV